MIAACRGAGHGGGAPAVGIWCGSTTADTVSAEWSLGNRRRAKDIWKRFRESGSQSGPRPNADCEFATAPGEISSEIEERLRRAADVPIPQRSVTAPAPYEVWD